MVNVLVIYHREADGWWAESPDVEGWTAADPTLPNDYEGGWGRRLRGRTVCGVRGRVDGR